MQSKRAYLAATILATGFCLFGAPGQARADAITVGMAVQAPGLMAIRGDGTFSVDATTRKLKKIEMIVKNADGIAVSNTGGIVLQGTTQWGSTSEELPAGTYTVSAKITTTNLQGGDEQTTNSMNQISGVEVQ